MKKRIYYLLFIFKSNYCKILFVLFFLGSYFLIPKTLFHGYLSLLAVLFMFSVSLTFTCLVRNTKERVLLAKTYKSSIIGLLATALGVSALQVCGIGAPVCGASVGLSIVSLIFPSVVVGFMDQYAVYLILVSIIVQILSLYYLKCFKHMCRNEKGETVSIVCEDSNSNSKDIKK